MYKERRMDPNESVGMMAAHSIGEPGTQMNMRTFHHAGVANINVTLGLPRLIEIVDARRVPSTPSMNIPLIGDAAEDEGVARRIAFEIETTVLDNVASLKADSTNMVIEVQLINSALSARGLTKEEIADKLNKVRLLRGLVEVRDFDILIRCDEPSFKKLQMIYEAAKAAKIKGIDGITRAVLARDEKTGRWYIVTEGSNLKEVLKVPSVDAERTMTNSILEIGEVLGIEAARNSIIKEAKGTLGEAGLNVDTRHIMLVSDLMTNDGAVKAIGRHGISGRKSSVLARAAFEITAPHLLRAAMNGEVDNLEGVAENIIVGQPVTLGTGAVNLVYSPKKKKGDKK
jgi:DNA-directed RNA polymerase subunit A"